MKESDKKAINNLAKELSELVGKGDIPAALAAVEEMIELAPDERRLLILQIELMLSGGMCKEGLEKAEELCLRGQNDETSLISLSHALFENMKFEEALEILVKLERLFPNNYEALYYLAHTLARLGDLEAAEKAIKRAVKIAPRDFLVYPSLKPDEIAVFLSDMTALLPEDVRERFAATSMEIKEVPSTEELTRFIPHLSPFTTAIFVDDTIKIYMKNLEWTSSNYNKMVINAARAIASLFEEHC